MVQLEKCDFYYTMIELSKHYPIIHKKSKSLQLKKGFLKIEGFLKTEVKIIFDHIKNI